LKPDAAGVYRIAVTAAGESQIVAQEGNVEVFAPAGSAWVVAGRKMLARGPQDNPEFKIAGAASADFSGGHSHAWPEPKTAAAPSRAAHPVGARAYGRITGSRRSLAVSAMMEKWAQSSLVWSSPRSWPCLWPDATPTRTSTW
jgi:hypothetical protein